MFKFFGSKIEVPTELPSKEVYLNKSQIEKNRRNNNYEYLLKRLKEEHLKGLREALIAGASHYHFYVDSFTVSYVHRLSLYVDLPEGITEKDIELVLAKYLQGCLKDKGYSADLYKCKYGYRFNFDI